MKNSNLTSTKSFKIALAVIGMILLIGSIFVVLWRGIDWPMDYTQEQRISPDRGEIFDCNGNVIATNKDLYDVHMDCCVVSDQKQWEEKSRKLAQELSVLLPERTAPQWWDYLQNARQNRRRYIPIVRNVESTMVDSLSKLTLFNEGKYKGGIIRTCKSARVYPYGSLARRTIGYGRGEYDEYRFGLECQYNCDLDGDEGVRTVKHAYRFGKLRRWETDYIDPVDGWDIYTTIDMESQALADSLLRVALESNEDIVGGCLALIEVSTGNIRALANMHRLDDGKLGEYFNYALDYLYEPGEVIQTMTLAAALSDGVIKSADEKMPTNHGRLASGRFPIDGYILNYEKRNQVDSISIRDGFSASSRYVFSNIASHYAETPDYYYDWFKSFSLRSYDFDLTGLHDIMLTDPDNSDPNTLMAMGSGYQMRLSPLHVLSFYNAIANNGVMVTPKLLQKMHSKKYGAQYEFRKDTHGQIIRQEITDTLKSLLADCVQNGTAQRMKASHVPFAGKTGTARQVIEAKDSRGGGDVYRDEDGRSVYASTMVGFYPVDEPQYSVICVLTTGATMRPVYGGDAPSNIVASLLRYCEMF